MNACTFLSQARVTIRPWYPTPQTGLHRWHRLYSPGADHHPRRGNGIMCHDVADIVEVLIEGSPGRGRDTTCS